MSALHPESPALRPATTALQVQDFQEISGKGISARVEGHSVKLGSQTWLKESGLHAPEIQAPGGVVHVAIDGQYKGAFVLANSLRPQIDELLKNLGSEYELALLSGDNEKERQRLQHLFGSRANLRFHQSPAGKLEFIRERQGSGKTVMMVGDGLNDAGALKQSDVGVAVAEKAAGFSPASDVIIDGAQVPSLGRILHFTRKATRIVRLSFGLSALYNSVGIGIAAAGVLSPLICAVLMPLSSISVVLFAAGTVAIAARRTGLRA
jgi:Cu+-exporting ATPase